ncbi:MAG: tRNA 2-thiouridine(34) synthase MnmA [Terriglobia bacterium]
MTIAVAMSGGVDSSTVAAILTETHLPANGFPPVVGLTMQLWNQRRLPALQGMTAGFEPGRASGRCCSLDDVYDARRVANFLNIPYYVVSLEKRFEEDVVRPFVEQYLAGETPVPCSHCNTAIKFDQFVDTALRIGAERIATGHYARVRQDKATGRFRLFAAVDAAKDQSYFLFGLTQEQLSRAIFPLGELTKQQVRAIAREKKLPVAEKAESQEICFIPNRSYREFIAAYLAEQGKTIEQRPGELVTTDGRILGEHPGVHHFTVGQRRGLGFAAGSPLYVTAIDAKQNRVTVGSNEELFKRRCRVRQINWIRPAVEGNSIEARVRIRNRHAPALARIEALGNSEAAVEFAEPQRAITPGQAAVFYDGDEVIGGGWIAGTEGVP